MFSFLRGHEEPFAREYRCHSVTLMEGKTREAIASIEHGGKIIMPPEALDQLVRMNVMYPMLFSLENNTFQRKTHCGVLEFVAPPGTIFIPHWMMQNLLLAEGARVRLENVQLPLCSYAKFKALSVDFLEISNPKAVLEKALRTFACLTVDDIIAVQYNGKIYEIRVVSLRPHRAVSIIECDMELDFDAPEGYVEPTHTKAQAAPVPTGPLSLLQAPLPGTTPPLSSSFSGDGFSLRAKPKSSAAAAAAAPTPPPSSLPPSSLPPSSLPPSAPLPPGALPFMFGKLSFPRPDQKGAAEAPPPAPPADTFRGEGNVLRPARKP